VWLLERLAGVGDPPVIALTLDGVPAIEHIDAPKQ